MLFSRGEKIFQWINNLFLVLMCIIMVYPLLYVLGRSFMTDAQRATQPFAILPADWTFVGYSFMFRKGSYTLNAYGVTILRTVIGTFLNIAFTAVLAYVLSRKDYPLRVPLTMLIVLTMWFSGGLIPSFLLIRLLGLMNNFWVYIIPGLISPWNALVLRNFFMQLPESLEESARIDGAREPTILVRIVLPLSLPALMTIALFYAVGHWNAWFDATIFVSDRKLWTLQVMLRELLRSASVTDLMDPSARVEMIPPSDNVRFATIVCATVPILCVYPFLQRHFVKGMLVGSLKG